MNKLERWLVKEIHDCMRRGMTSREIVKEYGISNDKLIRLKKEYLISKLGIGEVTLKQLDIMFVNEHTESDMAYALGWSTKSVRETLEKL